MNARVCRLGIFLVLFVGACGPSSRDYLDKANKLFSSGKQAEAILNYRKAIQKDSRFGEAYYRLGLAELKGGHPAEGYRALTQAAVLLPDRDDVNSALANLLLSAYLGDRNRPKHLYDQLADLSKRLLAKNPKSYEGLRVKAYLAATDGKIQEALELFRQADSVKPWQPDLIQIWADLLFRARQSEEGEKLALGLIQKDPHYGPIYDLLYRQYATSNRPADAEKIITAKVSNNPKEAAYALQLASYYAMAGQREKMRSALQRLLDNPQDFPDARLQVGAFYSRLQEWDLALEQYEAGAKANPKAKIPYLKGITNVWLSQGKGEQAAKVVDQIIQEKPEDEETRAVHASLLMKSGDPKKIDLAVAEFQDLVNKNPTSPVLSFNLGMAILAKGNPDNARKQFLDTIQKHKNYAPALLEMANLSQGRGDYAETIRYADEVLKLNPSQPMARLLRSEGLMGAGKLPQAGDELTRLQKDFPKFREAERQLGFLDLAKKKYPEAAARFRKVYEEDPRDGAALAGIVRALISENHAPQAYTFLEGELKKTPDSEAARTLLAEVAVLQGKYDVAIDHYRQILAHKPRAGLYVQLAAAYRRKGDMANAIASLDAAEKLAPADASVAALLAETKQSSGRKQEAIADYRRILQLKPDNPAVMNNLAFLIVETGGNVEEAVKLAQEASRKAPQQPNFSDTLAWIYLKKGMVNPALQVFGNLAKKYPDNPTFHYHLAMALRQTGNEPGAKKEFQTALTKKPSTELTQVIQVALDNKR